MSNVISKLEAVLTLDNKQFLAGLSQSSRAIKAFSRELTTVNTKLAGVQATLKKLSKVNINVTGATGGSGSISAINNYFSNIEKGFAQSAKGASTLAKAGDAAYGAGALANLKRYEKSVSTVTTALAAGVGARLKLTDKGFIKGSYADVMYGKSGKVPGVFGTDITDKVRKTAKEWSDLSKATEKAASATGHFGKNYADIFKLNAPLKAVVNTQEKLADVTKKVSTATKEVGESAKNTGGLLQEAFKPAAILAAAAAIIEVGASLAKTRKELENAQRAFERLNDPGLLFDLQKATGGMVDDLHLMQTTIQAVNLGISQNNLATYFKFATIRAAETGKEVSALVDQLILGIGRKSTQRLDDLGLSLVRIQAEVKKTGDFAQAVGNIIREEMSKTGVSIDDVASNVVKLNTAWDNFIQDVAASEVVGLFDKIAGKIGEVIDSAMGRADITTGKTGAELEEMLAERYRQLDALVAARRGVNQGLIREINQILDALNLSWEGMVMPEPPVIDLTPEVHYDFSKIQQSLQKEIQKLQTNYESWIVDLCPDVNEVLCEEDFPTPEDYIPEIPTESYDAFSTTAINEQLDYLEHLRSTVKAGSQAWKEYTVQIEELDSVLMGLTDTMTNLGIIMEDMLSAAFSSFTNMVADVMEGKNIINAFKDFLSQMGRLMATYGALLMAQGIAQKAFEMGDAYTKIAAGAAMLALGLAVAGVGASINTLPEKSGGIGGGRSATYGGGLAYDYNREIILVARGEDLVAVLNRQNYRDGING